MGEKAYIVTETIGGMLWQSYPEVYVQENLFENIVSCYRVISFEE